MRLHFIILGSSLSLAGCNSTELPPAPVEGPPVNAAELLTRYETAVRERDLSSYVVLHEGEPSLCVAESAPQCVPWMHDAYWTGSDPCERSYLASLTRIAAVTTVTGENVTVHAIVMSPTDVERGAVSDLRLVFELTSRNGSPLVSCVRQVSGG